MFLQQMLSAWIYQFNMQYILPVNTNHTQNCVAHLNLKSGWPTAPKVMVGVSKKLTSTLILQEVHCDQETTYYLYALVQSI